MREGLDLVCTGTGAPVNRRSATNTVRVVTRNFYGRRSYHLFESIYGTLLASFDRVEHSDTVVGSLYRQALRATPAAQRPPPLAVRQRVQIKGE